MDGLGLAHSRVAVSNRGQQQACIGVEPLVELDAFGLWRVRAASSFAVGGADSVHLALNSSYLPSVAARR